MKTPYFVGLSLAAVIVTTAALAGQSADQCARGLGALSANPNFPETVRLEAFRAASNGYCAQYAAHLLTKSEYECQNKLAAITANPNYPDSIRGEAYHRMLYGCWSAH